MSSIQTASTIGTAAAPFPWFDFNDAVAALPRWQKEDIRARLLDQLESALAYLLPRGERRGAQFVVGNVQGDAGDSLVVDLDGTKRGLWLDFATGESGDALALWAAVCGFVLPQQFDVLLEDIGHWLVVPRVAVPITVPSSAPHDDPGPATAKWNYHDANGKLLACVYRCDPPGGKQYRPWDVASRTMRMPDPRPLYNLERFTKKGLNYDDAERLADKLVLRDREVDDRRLCLECSHLHGAGRWRCGNWHRAGVAIQLKDAHIPRDLVLALQRCPGFGG